MFSQLSADDVAKLFEKEARNAHEAIRNETRSRENAFRNAFVLAVNKSGEQYSITAEATTVQQEGTTGADVILSWPTARERDYCYLQFKLLYKSYNAYREAILASQKIDPNTIFPWKGDDTSRWTVAEPYFDAVYQSRQEGENNSVYQAVSLAETVEQKNQNKAIPIAAGGFLLIGTDRVSVLPLGSLGAVLSRWREVTRAGLDKMTGSKLNKVMESTQGVGQVVYWPQHEASNREMSIKHATPSKEET